MSATAKQIEEGRRERAKKAEQRQVQREVPGYGAWVSLKDKLPGINERVIWYDKMFDNVEIFGLEVPAHHDGDFTHWMPLPTAP